jgi:hypothetical protein
MRYVAFALVLGFLTPATTAADDVASLSFLVGEWQAIGTIPGETGGFTFALGVQNHLITRTNYAVYEARDGRPASRHDDLMVIYREGDSLKADYFDSEQHVIRYVVQSKADREVTFTSEPTTTDPRYRLTYVKQTDGTLVGRFDIAAPGASSEFKEYLNWSARRVQQRRR